MQDKENAADEVSNYIFNGYDKIDIGGFPLAVPVPDIIRLNIQYSNAVTKEPLFVEIIVDEVKKAQFHAFYPAWFMFISDIDEGRVKGEKNEQLSTKNLKPYLLNYAKGFEEGYHQLDSLVEKRFKIINNSDDKARAIFNLAVGFAKAGGFPVRIGNKLKRYIRKTDFFEAGKTAGTFYRSWYIIYNQPSAFLSMFNSTTASTKISHSKEQLSKSIKTLGEIWKNKSQKHYQRVIEFLKEPNNESSLPFVDSVNNWVGQIVILGAFIKVCRKHEYIPPNISQAEIERILNKTFNLTINENKSFSRKFIFSQEQEEIFKDLPKP